MTYNYICSQCGAIHCSESLTFRCHCGGLLNLDFSNIIFNKRNIIQDEYSIFRYIDFLPLNKEKELWKEVSMGEGLTPIIPLGKDYPNLLIKLDFLMPTLSFKDRGAAVLITRAKELGVKKVIQDSSGNAGNSVAAYASRMGMECDIYLPENTSEKKIQQIKSYGASVHITKGSREDTARAALNAAVEGQAFYASHVYNPFFYQGTKTFMYEVYEQLEGELPDILMIPIGNGTLLLGVYYGLRDLLKSGLIARMPRIIGVQSENCAPIYKAFRENKDYIDKAISSSTLAEGIAIADPKRAKQILQAIRESKGGVIASPEHRIKEAMKYLSSRGIYVEPTAAISLGAYFHYIEEKQDIEGQKILIPLTGSGLKAD